MNDASKPDQKPDLRTRLIDAAEVEIAEKGLAGLKARDVTQRAGVALGAIYNAVADLDELVQRVNSRTLVRLGAALTPASDTTAPEAGMLTLADAYAVFALNNRRLWSALFEHRLPEGVEMPDWHRQDHEVLIARIGGPLTALRPDLPAEVLRLRVRTLFGAVHGVVHLALQGRLVGLPDAALRSEVAALVTALVAGARQIAGPTA
jgi:AcrR family transcriptional regulator